MENLGDGRETRDKRDFEESISKRNRAVHGNGLVADIPAENGAKALRSLIISGWEYQRSGMKACALAYTFSPVKENLHQRPPV